jgi:hypothetical protein
MKRILCSARKFLIQLPQGHYNFRGQIHKIS